MVKSPASGSPTGSSRLNTVALAETRLKQLLALTKPRVVSLIVFCAVIGMFLATPGLPLPSGELTSLPTLTFAGIVGGVGLTLLYLYVNELTMWLTLATFVGYAVVYTVLLKPATPQNIV